MSNLKLFRRSAGQALADVDRQIKVMKASKGMGLPVVALPGMGRIPAQGHDEKGAARVFYVAVTRATQRLVIGVCEGWGMMKAAAPKLATRHPTPPARSWRQK